ncbi:MAG: maleylpyruvate isomerase family mycothiol-dependent enzyme [bacterium]|nr:maleylpyruvate isomerase family mycothiol-dependent enzyme [bacterium]
MIDYIAAIAAESARFSRIIREVDEKAPVPSCPDWSLSDLAWHLAEVQYFWASIAEGLLTSPDTVVELSRPDHADLPALFDAQSKRLIAALTAHDPDSECWSWHDAGHNIGWSRRRQAHEALIHRIDAELAAGAHSPVDADLATDGIDEVLSVMIDASSIPAWSSFEADGRTAAISVHGGPTWSMQLGQFTGTSPNTGNTYDDPALLLAPTDDPPTVSIHGTSPELNRWLWGRGSIEPLTIAGSVPAAEHVRAAAAEGTQ